MLNDSQFRGLPMSYTKPLAAVHSRPRRVGRAVALALVACVGLTAAANSSAAAEADFADTAARIRGTQERELSVYDDTEHGARQPTRAATIAVLASVR
jgi:hypothetical protein